MTNPRILTGDVVGMVRAVQEFTPSGRRVVGTFYAAQSPEAPPFIQVGTQVGPDTVVCILEAMKVFNEIKAEVSGVVERVLAHNEDAVEYGQELFLVRPPG